MKTINIRVMPNAGKNEVSEEEGGNLKVRVTASPERGKANKMAIKLLAKFLGVKTGDISIVRGAKSRDKVIAVKLLIGVVCFLCV